MLIRINLIFKIESMLTWKHGAYSKIGIDEDLIEQILSPSGISIRQMKEKQTYRQSGTHSVAKRCSTSTFERRDRKFRLFEWLSSILERLILKTHAPISSSTALIGVPGVKYSLFNEFPIFIQKAFPSPEKRHNYVFAESITTPSSVA